MSTGSLPHTQISAVPIWPLVQSCRGVSSGTAASITSSSLTTTSGNSFIVAVGAEVGSRIGSSSVTDNKGNTYTRTLASTSGGGPGTSIFYVRSGSGGAGHTWTFTPSSSDFCWIIVIEVTNLASSPLNGTNSATTAGTSHASGNITSTAPELWIGAGDTDSGAEGIPNTYDTFLTVNAFAASGSNEGGLMSIRVVAPGTTGQFTWIAGSATRESMISGFKLLT